MLPSTLYYLHLVAELKTSSILKNALSVTIDQFTWKFVVVITRDSLDIIRRVVKTRGGWSAEDKQSKVSYNLLQLNYLHYSLPRQNAFKSYVAYLRF